MSERPNIGAVITLDGEKEYRKAISDVTKVQQVLKSELRALSSEYDGNANSADALRNTHELLMKQQTEQEKKLAILRGALQDATKKYGENSKQVQDWQIKLNNSQVELNKLNKEINENEKYLNEAEKSVDKTAKSIDGFGNQIKEAKKETSTFGSVLKANLASEAIIGGIKAIGNGIKDIISSTEEYRKDFSVLEQNASNAGASVSDVAVQLKQLDALTQETDSNVEALSNLLEGGFKDNSLAEVVNLLSGAVIKFPDTLKIESLADSLQETLATGSATGQFAELIERLGYNVDTFNTSMENSTSITEKQQHAMNVLASSGLAKVNEEYVKNNQSMIEYYNAQYELREVMSQIAVATLPLLSKAMGVMSENIGDITETALPILLDSFIWIVDNADLIEASLKGVGAALITKKAADGITYAITAYKTLTTATQTATIAQTAFNTATKANVIGAIAGIILGLGTALFSYATSANEAANATSELTKSINTNIEVRNGSVNAIDNEIGAIRTLSDQLYTLADKQNKSNNEKQQMLVLVEKLNKQVPTLNLTLDEQSGILNKNRTELNQLTDAYLKHLKVQNAKNDLENIAQDQYTLEKQIEEQKELVRLKEEEIKAYKETNSLSMNNYGLIDKEQKLNLLKDRLVESEESMKKLGEQWNETLNYIGENQEITETTNALDEFGRKYKEALEIQTELEVGSLEDRNKMINKLYKESVAANDKKIKEENKLLEKKHKDQVEGVNKASKSEMTILEANHKKKLELIDEEYLERMKNIDEDKYNQLKTIQSQIDELNNQSEAEERAIQAREEAEKKAELQLRIETAKTSEERLEAQEELKKYEEETARKRLLSERNLQIDVLEEQKKTIEATYESKVEALEKEEEIEKEKINSWYEQEKESIQDRLELKLSELEDIQEQEKESLDERQLSYKTYLSDQKELAIENAKAIYEEDLRQFKINNALKYDEVISSEDAMKKTMLEYANNSLLNGHNQNDALNIINSTNINDMIKYYDPSTLTQTNGIQNIEYDMFTKAMQDALKKTNLTVVMNEREIGRIMDGHIYQSIN